MSPRSLTLLSNGHGEDAVGVQLAREIARQRPDYRLQAFPTVGEGAAYTALELPVVSPRRALPSGGLLMHDPQLLWADLRAGFLGLTGRQIAALCALKTDDLIVIGDIYALALGGLVRTSRRFYVQTLVSVHHTGDSGPLNRHFMERIGYLERVLMRHLARRVYVRDEATARALKALGLSHVSAPGNPMLDGLGGAPIALHANETLTTALLPGTRRYAPQALELMLSALAKLPEMTGLVAWAGGELPQLPAPWHEVSGPLEPGLRTVYANGDQRVYLYEGRFPDVLRSASLVLGTSGTANEQAAALGRPVVSFPVPPWYGPAFLRNQARLLGTALTVVEPTSEAIASALRTLLTDPAMFGAAARTGPVRMGGPGGTQAIVNDVLRVIEAGSASA